MSKAKNPSVNIVPEKNSSDYLSATKLIANGRPDPTNPDWVAIQRLAKLGDIKVVDNLLSNPETNYAAKKLAQTAISIPPLLDEQTYFSQLLNNQQSEKYNPQSILLHLLGAEGYTKTIDCIIESQMQQLIKLQKQIDGIPELKKIMTSDAQIELTERQNKLGAELAIWQSFVTENIDKLLNIAVNHGHHELIELIHDKRGDKLDLNIFNASFPYKNTLLATAAKLNHFSVVEKLLQYDADPNVGNGETEMALIHAILNGNIKMAKLLIKNGASLDTIARHRSSLITKNDEYKFSEKEINVDEAIKLAPNSEAMAKCLDEIRSRGEFFRQEMLRKGDTSPLVQNLANWHEKDNLIIEEEVIGQNVEPPMEEQ